ncbi:MAG: acyl--CoA ligase [gamma proteobacterium symbiont of Bathyaustriella thionipta]|nr:acyl--CoA ligase [gamma proteobacterium symbiont of Bathyaustriella thionipta]
MTANALFDWLEQARQNSPQHTAWLTPEKRYSYADLYQHTQNLAAHYRQAGLIPGKPVAVVCASKRQLAHSALLAFYLGCPLLPLKPRQQDGLRLLKQCNIRQLITDTPKHYPGLACFSLPPARPQQAPADCLPQALKPTQTQLLIATSGSTGSAKISRHNGNSLLAAVESSRHFSGLTATDIWLNCLPMQHIAGFAILLRCLHASATMFIQENFDAKQIFQHVQQHSVTHLSLVPAMLQQLLDIQGKSHLPASLRTVLVGGGPLSTSLAQKALHMGWPISVTWGMSETASHVTLCPVTADWKTGKVGKPVKNCSLEIFDQQGHILANGRQGRIRIKGPMLMQGYCHREPLDIAEGFISSDNGYLDEQGHLHHCGRSDQQLVSGGYNIDPQSLEARISRCPGIQQVAISSIEDATWGDRLVLLYNGSSSCHSVDQWCQKHLDSWQRPRQIVKLEQLPTTSLGKPDRLALKKCAAQLVTESSNDEDR